MGLFGEFNKFLVATLALTIKVTDCSQLSLRPEADVADHYDTHKEKVSKGEWKGHSQVDGERGL